MSELTRRVQGPPFSATPNCLKHMLQANEPVDVCSHSSSSSKSWYSPSNTSPLKTGGSRGKKFSCKHHYTKFSTPLNAQRAIHEKRTVHTQSKNSCNLTRLPTRISLVFLERWSSSTGFFKHIQWISRNRSEKVSNPAYLNNFDAVKRSNAARKNDKGQ